MTPCERHVTKIKNYLHLSFRSNDITCKQLRMNFKQPLMENSPEIFITVISSKSSRYLSCARYGQPIATFINHCFFNVVVALTPKRTIDARLLQPFFDSGRF